MSKYSKYRYSELLKFLDFRYECESYSTNYAMELIRMKEVESLRSLVKRYNKIYSILLEYLNSRVHTGHKSYDEDLNTCFNENLVRLFMEEESPSSETCTRYLVNVRECPYIEEYQKSIVGRSTELYGDAFAQKANNIIQYQKLYCKAYDEFLYTYFEPGSNGYKKLEENVKRYYNFLTPYGYVRTMADYDVWAKTISIIVSVVFIAILSVFVIRCTT